MGSRVWLKEFRVGLKELVLSWEIEIWEFGDLGSSRGKGDVLTNNDNAA